MSALGIDDGHSNIKLVTPEGRCILLPSRAVSGALAMVSISGQEARSFEYETRDGSYTVGEIPRTDPTNFNGYPTSGMNAALVAHALRVAGFGGKNVSVCTGLPLKTYYRNGRINEKLILEKQQNLLKNDVKAKDQSRLATITHHEVISEGIGAWIDFIMTKTADGQFEINNEMVSKRIAIVDLGGRTTDIAVIQNWDVDTRRSGTIEEGMLKVNDILRDRVLDEYSAELDDEQVDRALNEGKIQLFGQDMDASTMVKDSKSEVIGSIRNEVMKRLGNGADLYRVLFVGGGSLAFGEQIKAWFPHNHVMVDNPVFANARGMQKFAEFSF